MLFSFAISLVRLVQTLSGSASCIVLIALNKKASTLKGLSILTASFFTLAREALWASSLPDSGA